MALHSEGNGSGKAPGDETGDKVERADGDGPPVHRSAPNSDFCFFLTSLLEYNCLQWCVSFCCTTK